MIKKIVFISILLLVSMGCVVAFELPAGFEHEFSLDYNGDVYTNNYGDKDSGQIIEVLTHEDFDKIYLNDYENFSFTRDGDIFNFVYTGNDVHSGIGNYYGDYVVLFWNKDSSLSNDNLKSLIEEFNQLNQ